MMRLITAILTLLGLLLPAVAETVEVAAGVWVTKRTFDVPINEQPFFGFAKKTPAMIQADQNLVAQALQELGSHEIAFTEAIRQGWEAIAAGDLVKAGHRFNQASLFKPDQSDVFFGFAVLVRKRFQDYEYAEELFRTAFKQPNPSRHLRAEYGKVLLLFPRWEEALPILEQAVLDAPEEAQTWINLSITRLRTGNPVGACTAAKEAEKRVKRGTVNDNALVEIVMKEAKC